MKYLLAYHNSVVITLLKNINNTVQILRDLIYLK